MDKKIKLEKSIKNSFKTKGKASAIDKYVGSMLRARRMALNMSQVKLAQKMNITFQQIQKYEAGMNRISASSLHALSKILKVPVSHFFDGYDNNLYIPPISSSVKKDSYSLEDIETKNLIEIYYSLPDAEIRKRFLKLIKGLAKNLKRQEKSN